MRMSIFGLGYVGCVTAACLARAGHDVTGVDVNPDKVAMINDGKSPIVEPGLGDLIAEQVACGRLKATTSVEAAVAASDLGMICVGTPSARHGGLDVSAIERVGEDIGRATNGRRYTVVLRSTVLPGTTETVLTRALGNAENISIAVNPEFMREGTSLLDFAHPPMTLIGSSDDETAAVVARLYESVDAPLIQTSVKVAEMAKYVSNAYHALKICFANEIGDLCETLGVDAQEVTRTFLADKKLNVSEAYLKPGFAFGGSCLPKDLRALMHVARKSDIDLPLLGAIKPSNEHQIQRGVDAVLATRKKRVAVVGLAFKSGTDDLRESPMVALVETLIGKGLSVRIFDPNVQLAALVGANRQYIEKEIPHISSLMCDDIEALVQSADVLVIGAGGADAKRALSATRPDHIIIDLTRNTVPAATPATVTEAAISIALQAS